METVVTLGWFWVVTCISPMCFQNPDFPPYMSNKIYKTQEECKVAGMVQMLEAARHANLSAAYACFKGANL